MDDRVTYLHSLVKAALSSLTIVNKHLDENPSVTRESSTEVRDELINAQSHLGAAFRPLKDIRRELFVLRPSEHVVFGDDVTTPG